MSVAAKLRPKIIAEDPDDVWPGLPLAEERRGSGGK
jgi:hypothetical protein